MAPNWGNWWLPRKDCLPKELGNLPKNMIHEFKKWYYLLNEWEAKWRSRSYVNTAETAHIVWSHILMSRMELEFATCRLMWAMGLFTGEVWVQKRHGTKPKRWYEWERFKPNTPAHIAITEKLEQLLYWEGPEHYTTEAMTQYRRWACGFNANYEKWTVRFPNEGEPAAFIPKNCRAPFEPAPTIHPPDYEDRFPSIRPPHYTCNPTRSAVADAPATAPKKPKEPKLQQPTNMAATANEQRAPAQVTSSSSHEAAPAAGAPAPAPAPRPGLKTEGLKGLSPKSSGPKPPPLASIVAGGGMEAIRHKASPPACTAVTIIARHRLGGNAPGRASLQVQCAKSAV